MAATVVDHLELVEIEVAHDVAGALMTSQIDHLLQTILEFTTVLQSGQIVIGGLVAQLVRQLAHFGHIHHGKAH